MTTAPATSTGTALGPRLTAKGAATRARIVEAAADLMLERGVAGTSIDEVRRAAGVSGSQMSHYFASKQALVEAVVELRKQRNVGSQEAFFANLDSLDDLRHWARTIVGIQSERDCQGGCTFGSLASELAECEEARPSIQAGFDWWERMIRDGLRSLVDRGVLRADADPERLAVGLLATVQGGLLLTQTARDTRPLEFALDAMLDHIASYAA